METFKELLNFACFIIIMYFLFCVLQYAPQFGATNNRNERGSNMMKLLKEYVSEIKELTILKKEN